jgi:hypothetical protein
VCPVPCTHVGRRTATEKDAAAHAAAERDPRRFRMLPPSGIAGTVDLQTQRAYSVLTPSLRFSRASPAMYILGPRRLSYVVEIRSAAIDPF